MKQSLLVLSFFLFAAALSAQTSVKPDNSVFPNPATEYITVQDNADAVGQVAVFNLVGKKVKVFEAAKGESYYIGDLSKGVYLVQMIGRNNQVIKTQKVEKR